MARPVFAKTLPEGYRSLVGVQKYLRSSSLDPILHELVKIRASMINGCAYCVDVHSREVVTQGESYRRLISLSTWTEAVFFTGRERAALALTDAVTNINAEGVSDEVWDGARQFFSEVEICDLLLAIISINSFNRLAITTHMVPADHEHVSKSAVTS